MYIGISKPLSGNPDEEFAAAIAAAADDFEESTRDVLAESSILTGLSREKFVNLLDLVKEEDIWAAPEEKRKYLSKVLGKTYC